MNTLRKRFRCFYLILFAVILTVSMLTACGNNNTEQTPEETDTPERSGSIITVGFAQSGSGATWNAANIDSIRQSCSAENGFNLILENANDSFDNQIASIRSFIEQDVDVIGFSPLVADGWDEVLQKAKHKAADWIIEYMKPNYTGTEKIKVALFQGTIGASAEVGRTQGVEEMLNNAGNYEFVYKASGDFKYDGGG